MLRAIVLSLALLIGIGTLIPLATEYAEAGSHKPRKYQKKRAKKYSKRWWRAYNKRKAVKRAKLRRARKARLARARTARIRRARVARVRRARLARKTGSIAVKRSVRRSKKRGQTSVATSSYETLVTPQKADKYATIETPQAKTKSTKSNNMIPVANSSSMLPSGNPAPNSWKSDGYSQGELQFRVNDNSGSPIGSASISVVGPATEDPPMLSSRVKTVGGVTTTALRRTVIDQMIRENGWVVNDFQKEIGGKNVYVVVAQAPGSNNQVENRTYYFTEVEGKIFSVATKSPEGANYKFEEESEKVINSLQRKSMPTQVATNRTVSNLVANEE
jgi:hypothetical protein